MLYSLPTYIPITFVLITFGTLFYFYFAMTRSSVEKNAHYVLLVLLLWMILQGFLAWKEIYLNTKSIPPRFVFAALPALLTILVLFLTKKGKKFIDSLPMFDLTLLSVIRIPVELVLYWLFLKRYVPELMTFAGRNFDILSGITAPFVAYFGIQKGKFSRNMMLIWNFLCLGLLFNIVIHAILSAPFPFQKLAFGQPNVAVLYFPFIWLPSFVVPVVLFCHLASVRQLLYPSTINSKGKK